MKYDVEYRKIVDGKWENGIAQVEASNPEEALRKVEEDLSSDSERVYGVQVKSSEDEVQMEEVSAEDPVAEEFEDEV